MNCTSETLELLPTGSKSLYQAFSQMPDPRSKRGIRYPLAVILTVVTLGKLSGETEIRGIAQWARYRAAELRAAFGLERETMPHWTTYSRVLGQIDEQQLQAAMQRGLKGSVASSDHLLLDGKTLRGTIPSGQNRGEHLLAVYEAASRTVLAQASVGSKENEILVAPQLLKQVPLKGKIMSGDAMFTQRHLSEQIIAAGGHYVWTVKENQPHLYQMIERLFSPDPPRPGQGSLQTDFQSVCQMSKGHGRLERRTLTASSLLRGYANWPGMRQVFRLERYRHSKSSPATTQIAFGITSLDSQQASASVLLSLTRRHWAIENQLHYVRDVSLHEDACRLASPHAQRCLALLNNLVLALLPATPFRFLPDAQRFFNAHLAHALALLF